MNQKTALLDNIEAIKTVLENTSGRYSEKEIEKIKRYKGFGCCKAVLYSNDTDWDGASMMDKKLRDDIETLHTVLQDGLTGREYKVVIDSIKASILTSFYTPAVIPRTFYKVLKQYHEVTSLYEPSAGMGVFIQEAKKVFDKISDIQLYEKDNLTARLLKVATGIYNSCYNKPFEESESWEDGKYDLICSNIPFGSFPVFDKDITDRNITGKIHNYFFAKGLTKIKDGSILAYLVTSAFLDTVTNKSAREYLFMHSDFISLTIMPDNLMSDSANTEAPSHFLVVRKNSDKKALSEEEQLLIESVRYEHEGKSLVINKYCQKMGMDIVIGECKLGTDQYGKPAREVKWKGPVESIESKFSYILHNDFQKRYVINPIEIPVGKVIITGPGTFKWEEEDNTPPWLENDSIEIEETEEEHNARQKDMAEMEMGEGIYADEPGSIDPLSVYDLRSKHERDVMTAFLDIKNAYCELIKEEQG